MVFILASSSLDCCSCVIRQMLDALRRISSINICIAIIFVQQRSNFDSAIVLKAIYILTNRVNVLHERLLNDANTPLYANYFKRSA